ncbi:MAG: hypothetical protein EAZ91_13100 [Cytophagales bacterium]|nr:MAG: hypothetical protein EAZ91_13100 [Cytophagales bacterium]
MKTSRLFWLLTLSALLIWIATDLLTPQKLNIRQFEPVRVASIETSIWRSYQSGSSFQLYRRVAGGLRAQLDLSFWRSYGLAFAASRAATQIREAKSPAELETALPLLVDFYTGLQNLTTETFDPQKVARAELTIWKLRQQKKTGDELARALAAWASALYNLPPDRFSDFGTLRAQAIRQYDEATKQPGPFVKEAAWERMEQQLDWAWQGLNRVVR